MKRLRFSRKRFVALAVALFFAAFSYARQIAFQVIQHGAAKEVCGETYNIEDALLNWFFENGDIVTNEPAVAMDESESAAALKAALVPAKNGGAQYFVQIRLFYDKKIADINNMRFANIEQVRWTISDVATGREVADRISRVDQPAGKTDASGAKELAANIAGEVRSVLTRN